MLQRNITDVHCGVGGGGAAQLYALVCSAAPIRGPQFTLIRQGRRDWVIGWMFNKLSSNWVSLHDKRNICVRIFPNFINCCSTL